MAHSVLDSHERLRLRMSFSPIQGNSYHFYYKVGSGGGHQLVFHTGQLHLLMYDDDQSRNVSRNYSVLLAGGALTTVKFHSDGIHHGAFTTISGAGEAASTLLLPRMLHVRY